MKKIIYLLLLVLVAYSCDTNKKKTITATADSSINTQDGSEEMISSKKIVSNNLLEYFKSRVGKSTNLGEIIKEEAFKEAFLKDSSEEAWNLFKDVAESQPYKILLLDEDNDNVFYVDDTVSESDASFSYNVDSQTLIWDLVINGYVVDKNGICRDADSGQIVSLEEAKRERPTASAAPNLMDQYVQQSVTTIQLSREFRNAVKAKDKYIGKTIIAQCKADRIAEGFDGYNYIVFGVNDSYDGFQGVMLNAYTNSRDFVDLNYPAKVLIRGILTAGVFPGGVLEMKDCELLGVAN